MDRATGEVVGEDHEASTAILIAPDLGALQRASDAYLDALRVTDDPDRGLRAVARALRRSLREIDPRLLAPDGFWALAAQEIELGVVGGLDPGPPAITIHPARGPQVAFDLPLNALNPYFRLPAVMPSVICRLKTM